MTEIAPPFIVENKFVVEIMKNNNHETIEYHYYNVFQDSLQHYEKIKDREYLVTLAMHSTIKRDNGTEDFKKWVVAKNM